MNNYFTSTQANNLNYTSFESCDKTETYVINMCTLFN